MKTLVTVLFIALAQVSIGQTQKFLEKILHLRPYNGNVFTDTTSISFVGNGNLQKAIADESDIPVNTGMGLLFSETFDSTYLLFYKVEVEANFNVASTSDSIQASFSESGALLNRDAFGASILTPLNVGGFNSGYFDFKGYFSAKPFNVFSGIHYRMLLSTQQWFYNEERSRVSVTGHRISLFHEFIRPNNRDDYSLQFGLGAVNRSIGGNILSDDKADLRTSIFTQEKIDKNYWGFLISFSARLKNVRAEISNTYLKGDNSIVGLTGNQIIASISFVGGFPLKLN